MKELIRKICFSFFSLYTMNTVDVLSTYIGCSPKRLIRWSQTQAWSSFWSHSALFLITTFEARAQILFHIMLKQFLLLIWCLIFHLISYVFLLLVLA